MFLLLPRLGEALYLRMVAASLSEPMISSKNLPTSRASANATKVLFGYGVAAVRLRRVSVLSPRMGVRCG